MAKRFAGVPNLENIFANASPQLLMIFASVRAALAGAAALWAGAAAPWAGVVLSWAPAGETARAISVTQAMIVRIRVPFSVL